MTWREDKNDERGREKTGKRREEGKRLRKVLGEASTGKRKERKR